MNSQSLCVHLSWLPAIHRIMPLARRLAIPSPGNREKQLRAGSRCRELTNKWFVAPLEAPVSLCPGRAWRLCRGELSRRTNLCFSSAVERGVAGSPRCPWALAPGVAGSSALAGTEAILLRLALRGVHALYPLHLVPPPLFACISFPGPPARFLLSFVFLLRRELFDAACSLFSSVRVRTRLTHNWQLYL